MKVELEVAVAIGAAVAIVVLAAVGLIQSYTGEKATESPLPEARERPQTAIPVQRIECDRVTPSGCLRWTVYRITEQ